MIDTKKCEKCGHYNGGKIWECKFGGKKDCLLTEGMTAPKTCAECPFSIENIEGDDETGYGKWYECKFIDGGANPGEKLRDCPLQAESEEEE